MTNWRLLLWPFSLIYSAVAGLRNLAFRSGILSSKTYDVPVISVGNLSTGGTGKTPMIEYLIRLLEDNSLGMVSRGYGRKTKGMIAADSKSSAAEIGDEPLQIVRKFPSVKVVVSEKRQIGIDHLLQLKNCDVILLDDAFQHRSVSPGLQILLTTYNKPYYQDLVLPAGNLRESRLGRSRADIIILTKCPANLGRGDAEQIRRKLKAKNHQKVFFSTVRYGSCVNHLEQELEPGNKVILLAGIAHPEPFLQQAENQFEVKDFLRYPDHHRFTEKDIQKIEQKLNNPEVSILTTEKDWVRLHGLSKSIFDRIYYQSIRTELLFGDEERLIRELRGYVKG